MSASEAETVVYVCVGLTGTSDCLFTNGLLLGADGAGEEKRAGEDEEEVEGGHPRRA